MERTKTKAKRAIKALDFTGANAAVALVSKEQGGGANGYETLLIKAANFSDEFLEKASQVQVTMEITEFLQRMFGMWYDDAEILARALGYTTAEMDDQAEGESGDDYLDYITSKVQSIEVMKQLYESDNTVEVLSGLTEDSYFALLQDQETIEKAFAVIDKQSKKNSSPSVSKTKSKAKLVKAEVEAPTVGVATQVANDGKGTKSSVNKSTIKKDDNKMTDEVQVIETEVEVVAKSQFDEILKAQKAQAEELQKALDAIEVFKQKEKEAIAKARKVQLDTVAGKHVDVFMKAVGEADEAVFADVVKALADMQKAVEQSDLFKEVGVSGGAEVTEESGVAKLLKAKIAAQSK